MVISDMSMVISDMTIESDKCLKIFEIYNQYVKQFILFCTWLE